LNHNLRSSSLRKFHAHFSSHVRRPFAAVLCARERKIPTEFVVGESKLRRIQPSQSNCCVRQKSLETFLSQFSNFALKMSSKNVFRAIVLVAAILDIIVNIFYLFSIYMARRDGDYIRYLWQWNLFHILRIATSALVLYSVIKNATRELIIAVVLNGLIFGCLLYAVSIAKFSYNNCERSSCRYTDNCVICERQNYYDYHLSSKWSRKFRFL
jgi:hypothetical protein